MCRDRLSGQAVGDERGSDEEVAVHETVFHTQKCESAVHRHHYVFDNVEVGEIKVFDTLIANMLTTTRSNLVVAGISVTT